MTDTTTAHSEPGQPLGLALTDLLGPLPEQTHFPGWAGIPYFTAEQMRDYALTERMRFVTAERDCRTCKHWTPHHRSDVMHCSAALRCVAGSSYKRAGVVQLWEAAPVDAAF